MASAEAGECGLLLSVLLNRSDEKALRALLVTPLYGFDCAAIDEWELSDVGRMETLGGTFTGVFTLGTKGCRRGARCFSHESRRIHRHR